MVGPNEAIGVNLSHQVSGNSAKIRRLDEQLSSARRITRFSEDAAGGTIADRFEAAIRGFQQEIRNDQDAYARLQVRDGSLGSVGADLQRIRELRVQQEGGLDIASFQAVEDEIAQRLDNVRQTLETNAFAGSPAVEPGESLARVLAGSSDLESVDAALAETTSQRGAGGAEMNAIQSRVANREVAVENLIAAQSRIADLDMARAASERVNADIRLQASVGALQSFGNVNRQNITLLLDGLS